MSDEWLYEKEKVSAGNQFRLSRSRKSLLYSMLYGSDALPSYQLSNTAHRPTKVISFSIIEILKFINTFFWTNHPSAPRKNIEQGLQAYF